jgi:Domain of unknown function (DUF1707)
MGAWLRERAVTQQDDAMISELPAGEASGGGNAPELRASHADRDKVVEILRVAAGDGRLTADELDQRLEAALTARTYRELAALTADLPPSSPAVVAPRATAPAQPKDVLRIQCKGANTRRVGGWLVLVTKPGIEVDADEVTLIGGHVRGKVQPTGGWNHPVEFRIEVSGENHGGYILARPPRRSFSQWLRRGPRRYSESATS